MIWMSQYRKEIPFNGGSGSKRGIGSDFSRNNMDWNRRGWKQKEKPKVIKTSLRGGKEIWQGEVECIKKETSKSAQCEWSTSHFSGIFIHIFTWSESPFIYCNTDHNCNSDYLRNLLSLPLTPPPPDCMRFLKSWTMMFGQHLVHCLLTHSICLKNIWQINKFTK